MRSIRHLLAVGIPYILSGISCANVDQVTSNQDVSAIGVDPDTRCSAEKDSNGRSLSPMLRTIVASNESVARSAHLLARIAVSDTELIEFYEPSRGDILISGAGQPTAASRSQSIREMGPPQKIWAVVSHDALPPPALMRAFSRWGTAIEDDERVDWEDGTSEESEIPDEQPVPYSLGWCDNNYFESEWGPCINYDFNVCRVDWWGGIWATSSNVIFLDSHVCAASGQITYNIYKNGALKGSWSVPKNTLRWYNGGGSCLWPSNDCPSYRATVTGASGKRFHFQFHTAKD